jgi:hypothetical protein
MKMSKINKKEISEKEKEELFSILKSRFEKFKSRHKNMEWSKLQKKLELNPEKIWSLYKMEKSGGEPDVVDFDKKTNEYVFFDCSIESPKDRRSVCFDREALNKRKENKPKNDAISFCEELGIEILNEDEYKKLQSLGEFDLKTSSWIATPSKIRKLGGALFADRRYDSIFIYHNGADSYYAARGFRGSLKV